MNLNIEVLDIVVESIDAQFEELRAEVEKIKNFHNSIEVPLLHISEILLNLEKLIKRDL